MGRGITTAMTLPRRDSQRQDVALTVYRLSLTAYRYALIATMLQTLMVPFPCRDTYYTGDESYPRVCLCVG